MADTKLLASANLISSFEQQNGIPKDALLNSVLMESELNPSAKNASSGASGLIQFLPSLLAKWGYSPDQVRNMSIIQQLPLIVRYFSPYMAKLRMLPDPFEYYLAIFWPAAIGQPENYVIAKKGSKVYSQNAAYAQGGVITKNSIRQAFYNAVNQKRKRLGLTAADTKKKSGSTVSNGSTKDSSVLNSLANNIHFFIYGY